TEAGPTDVPDAIGPELTTRLSVALSSGPPRVLAAVVASADGPSRAVREAERCLPAAPPGRPKDPRCPSADARVPAYGGANIGRAARQDSRLGLRLGPRFEDA